MREDISRFIDGAFIVDMVIATGEVDAVHGPLYTCRHLDAVTGDCGAYESRPGMCSEYPYGSACAIDGCTWTDATVVSAEIVRARAAEARAA